LGPMLQKFAGTALLAKPSLQGGDGPGALLLPDAMPESRAQTKSRPEGRLIWLRGQDLNL
jgi:hypothetical protein